MPGRPERLVAAAATAVFAVASVTAAFGSPPPSHQIPAGAFPAPRTTAPRPAPTIPAALGSGPRRRPAVAAGGSPTAVSVAGPALPLTGCPPPPRPPSPWKPHPLGAPAVPEAALPAPAPPAAKAHSLAAIRGKGIWITNWPGQRVDVPGIVRAARAAGLTSVWIRTGGSIQGYYGAPVLAQLVPAAHRAGLRVVAWDFPSLSDPVADARRAALALAGGIDGFAPDVETASEGTHATARRITLYLSLVRARAGARPVAATVPRPTESRLSTFPYSAFAASADAFVPMVYWSCNEPGLLVQQSIDRLRRWLPVAPVGQAYDMAADGGRSGLPSRAETWRFLDSATRAGAVGASLWSMESMGSGQWSALSAYPWRAG